MDQALVAKLKRDFRQNPGKSLVLAGLTAVLLAVGGNMLLQARPRTAAAAATVAGVEADPLVTADPDLEVRMQQSRQLWDLLRQERGPSAGVTFRFDPDYYTLDPSKRLTPETAVRKLPAVEKSDEVPSDAHVYQARLAALRDEASRLTLQTTVLGAEPKAVINSRIVLPGDRIEGFTVVAIRARQVLVEKDGITLSVEMK